MSSSVLILGGTGQIGRAAAAALAARGWAVTVAARDAERFPAELAERGVRFAHVDRKQPGELEAAIGDGVDALVDVVAFDADDASQLLALGDRIGSVVAISSASVYCDHEGRSLDDAGDDEERFPRLRVPIGERQRTVPPGPDTYSTRKVAMERALLGSNLRATIVRPCAIHGPGDRRPREWYFVQRILDGRRFVVLAHRGASRFHTTSVANLAELIRLAVERPGRRIVNCGDPNPPTVLEIARAIAGVLDHEWTEVLLPGAAVGVVGDHPWGVPRPFVVDMVEAELELRYRPVTTYERAVEQTVRWLVETRPEPADYMKPMFDYAAENAFLAGLGTRTPDEV